MQQGQARPPSTAVGMASAITRAGSTHPVISQLCRIIADPHGPFRSEPEKGYLRGIDFYSAASLPLVLRSAANTFRNAHGRYPNIVAPKSMNDKIFASKFLRPMKVPETGNKLLTSSFIPAKARKLVFVPTVVWHSKIAEIPRGDEIEAGTYYLKTSHGCDMYRRVTYPMSEEQADALDAEFKRYLQSKFGLRIGNWWHNSFEPEILLEKAVGSAEFTTSFNYLVIGGEVRWIVLYQKLGQGFRKSYFEPDWTPLPGQTHAEADFVMPSDAAKERMLTAARLIGGPLGFVRVDFLLDDEERPYLGEVTFTPGNALNPMPVEQDLKLGRMWDCAWVECDAKR